MKFVLVGVRLALCVLLFVSDVLVVHGLTPAERETLEMAFRAFDRNSDGRLTMTDLRGLMRVLEGRTDISNEEIRDMMYRANPRNSGKINFEEFLNAATVRVPAGDDEILPVFLALDKDKDGLITGSDINAFVMNFGTYLTADELAEKIREADSNGDGFVDYEDFRDFMKKMNESN